MRLSQRNVRRLIAAAGVILVAVLLAPAVQGGLAAPALQTNYPRRAFLPAVAQSRAGQPGPTPVPAGTAFYVATNGSDANPGTEAAPWRTIGKAARTAQAGQTVLIKAGTYAEKLRPANSGLANAWITFAACNGQVVLLDGSHVSAGAWSGLVDLSGRSYIKVAGLTASNSDYAGLFADGASQILFQANHTVHSVSSGAGIWNSTDVVLDGNDFEDSNFGGGNEALTVAGTGPFEIKNNRVHNPSANTAQALKEGIDVKQGSHDGSVHHNEVYQTQKVALYVDAFDRHTYNVDVYANRVHDVRMGITLASEAGGLLENVKVYNNVIWNVFYAGIRTFGEVDTADHPMQNISYTNNTVYNASPGINVSNTQITNFVVRNNIVTNNTGSLQFVDASKVTADHNLTSGDPLYANPAAVDFHLRAASPAINFGSSSGAPSSDLDSVTRPQGGAYDIGAYEAH